MKNYICDYCDAEKKNNPNLLYVTSVTKTSVCENCLQIALDKLKEKKTDVDLIEIYKEKNKAEAIQKKNDEIEKHGKFNYYLKRIVITSAFLIFLFFTIRFIKNIISSIFV